MNQDKTILVVEDDPGDQLLIVDAFRVGGATNPIEVVNNGAEAIGYLKGEGRYADRGKYGRASFILTDLKMAGGDGFGVLEYVRGHPGEGVGPPAVMSGSKEEGDVDRAYELGAGCYLQKTGDVLELQRQVKMLHMLWMQCEVL